MLRMLWIFIHPSSGPTLLSGIRGRVSHVVGHLVEWWICMHVINSSSLNNALYVAGYRANRQ